MTRGFLFRVACPIALGVLLALWLLGGDRDPDAADEFAHTCRVERETTQPTRGIEFFNLFCGDETFTVGADSDTQIATYLRAHEGKVRVMLAPFQAERLDR